jgi:SulP family sulfate permease
LFDSWRGYSKADFFSDATAGLTVGVIALPLAIGFAIASGVTPAQGLWTAIVAGALISILGGSRFQIGGPTGAFVPVLAGIVAQHGYAGLALATMLSGGMLVLMGALRLGGLLKFIPYPVIAGFTTGIAVIIFTAQLNEALGLGLKMPEHVPQQIAILAANIRAVDWRTTLVFTFTLAVIYLLPRITRAVPPGIAAVVGAAVFSAALDWPVATVGSRFGGIPAGLPGWHLPEFSLEAMRYLMGAAFTIAALGGIESLLSAAVADGMADTRHDSNQELIGQGVANLLCPLVGGIAATGAIARTAANIRSGARSPVAGLVHSAFLLLVALIAAPLARFIPLAALAAILTSVALRMAEWENFQALWHGSRTDFFVMLSTLGLTVVFDLTIGVSAGLFIAVAMFVRRMEEISHVHLLTAESDPEHEGGFSLRGKTVPEGVVLFRFHGPFFFAAADKLESALRTHGGKPRIVIFRMRYVPSMDGTGLHAFRVAIEKLHRDGVAVVITGIQPQPMKVLHDSGLAGTIGIDNFCGDINQALQWCRIFLGSEKTPA